MILIKMQSFREQKLEQFINHKKQEIFFTIEDMMINTKINLLPTKVQVLNKVGQKLILKVPILLCKYFYYKMHEQNLHMQCHAYPTINITA